jgi:hypothetical protein
MQLTSLYSCAMEAVAYLASFPLPVPLDSARIDIKQLAITKKKIVPLIANANERRFQTHQETARSS